MTTENALLHTAALLLDARIGLKPDMSFRPRLSRALRDLADARNMDRESLVAALAADASLLDQLLDRVTVQESAFFRHPEQFETFVRTLLPTIDVPLRAWSAACANGQEAYSLAMLVSEAGASGSVLASDISPAALRRTTAGYYHDREMRDVSAERRHEHFHVAGGGWQANQNLRDMVKVQRHNLLDPTPPQVAECHVVMCRNVLIYFTQLHAELFLDRLADVMDPAAYLFVGGAETLWQVTDRFEPVQSGACFAYRPNKRRALAAAPVIAATRTPAATTPRATVARPKPDQVNAVAVPVAEQSQGPINATGDDQERLGRQLLAEGFVHEAIVAFRQWAYLSPENPAAHLHLALALDDAHDRATARRAYRAALTALDRCDPDRLLHVLQGYERSELRRLLSDRSRADGALPEVAESPPAPRTQRVRPTVRS